MSLCLSKKEGISMGYDGSLKFDTEISEKGFNSGVKKLGSIAKGGLAVIGGAATCLLYTSRCV